MSGELSVSRVPPEAHAEAMRFISAGTCDDALADAQAALLDRLVGAPGREAPVVWWGCRDRRCVVAAMVAPCPGRAGLLLPCPVDAPGVESGAWAQVVRAASIEAIERGMAFVQSLVRPAAEPEISMLAAAGFECLAELMYLELKLLPPAASSESGGLVWRRYAEFDDEQLGRLIASTYLGSLDCPGLAGLRSMADVIAAHKDTGSFWPESWWIVAAAGHRGERAAPAGCVLVNEAGPRVAEMVYMGVVPKHRGKGLGEAIVAGAAARAAGRGFRMLTCAVDSRNVYARRIYDRLGFVATQQRLAMMMTPAKAKSLASSRPADQG